ncbi:hypothetical protein GCM10011415_04470 [Salipiger pallidus]|uniref:Putative Flp pilus-assembly TadG-like N-terminal domain-containing protein n=2 Tax=Salipiger pallidus TaxID=1775170 RepID=A0A8J2ZGR7_9RHOB|nr:hypothetical protein GCM10011415_04470 [Salipiger pallidus]
MRMPLFPIKAPCLSLGQLIRSDDGAGTLTSLFVLTVCLLMGGAAVDIANAYRVKEVLQANAEASAISGAVRMSEPLESETARDTARRIADIGLTQAGLSDAWHDAGFEVGLVDPLTDTFTPVPMPAAGQLPGPGINAVRVSLHRDAAHGNPEPLRVVGLFGFDPWDISGQAVAMLRNRPTLECIDPLLSLQARVDVSSRNAFVGICLHANAAVSYGEVPSWRRDVVDDVVNRLLLDAAGGGLLTSFVSPVQPSEIMAMVASVDRTVDLHDLDNLSVVSDGSLHVTCKDNEVLHLEDGFVLQNAAIYSDCPVRIEGEVSLDASLLVANLSSLLTDPDAIKVTPDALLTGSPACAPGDGVQILLFADLDAVVGIPALVSTDTPLGAFIDETVGTVGTVLDSTLTLVGGILNPLVDTVSDLTSDLPLLPICLNAETMLSSDTVALR